MPRSCCVVGCTNNCKKNNELKFYRIPKNEAVRRKWLNAINRAADSTSSKQWSPTSSNVYVCSAHFITGKRELFEKHPDSVPSIFDTGMKGSPQRNTNNNKINRVSRRINRQKISVPACKKLKLCAQSISEDVDFVIEKRSFSNEGKFEKIIIKFRYLQFKFV
ncbi:THAP domain-containing protein 11-like isoform X2 [Hydra vulgaris]|uniref:THAP domain-containing protein 11-like isoform X2 n=1 Tax=Hydra vulgaris TaxID=6087 RepID=UPI0032E9E319